MSTGPQPSPMLTNVARPLAPPEELTALRRLRQRLLSNTVRQALRQSRLRILAVVVLTALFWLGLFALFVEAFQFLETSIPDDHTHLETVRKIFEIFFLSLTVMLVFSSGVILYGGLYRSRETTFLLTTPARPELIFHHKFQEALLFSSWGFVLLGSPMLVAYGLASVAPWHYYATVLPFLIAFIYIPAAWGATICMLLVRWLPRRRRHLVLAASALALLLVGWLIWQLARGPQSALMTPDWFDEMLVRLRFSETRLLPSWWLSTGLLEAANDHLVESLSFLILTIANAMFFHQVALGCARALYLPGYHSLVTRPTGRRKQSVPWIDRLLERLTWPLSREMRLLIIKDARLFRRDPVQWSQFLIFFGLLGMYFLNIRRLSYDLNHATWVNMVSFLNLAVVGLILSTFTSRFIFPLISLEGRRFWILGRLPVRRDTILWGKFLFAALGSIVPCTLLIIASDTMLGVVPAILAVHLLTCFMLCVGLSGLAVGMGAKMPNLQEESPSRIAAGFGGTLNLVLSTIYIAAIVTLTAVPCHFYLVTQQTDPYGAWFNPARLRWMMAGGITTSVLLGILTAVWPMWIGLKAFRRMEF
ncbi:MAG: hypothetical protein JNG90_14220 [Planctomycetaceae bacterium]|nr:hypothetical protein [Planctomycetaceae bacterium]